MAELKIIYEPVLIDGSDGKVFYQAGAFPGEAEAQKVLDLWRAEGRSEEMAINIVAVYDTAEEWLREL